jgi:hypothetical protein
VDLAMVLRVTRHGVGGQDLAWTAVVALVSTFRALTAPALLRSAAYPYELKSV